MRTGFSQVDTLLGDHAPFLSLLEESPDNVLHIRLHASSVAEVAAEPPEGLSAPVAALVSRYRPIRPSGRTIDILFEDYILYQVRNESYTIPSQGELQQGKYLVIYERSSLLEYLSVSTGACQGDDGSFFPGPWTHYGICTQNQIIDVISHREPVLTVEADEAQPPAVSSTLRKMTDPSTGVCPALYRFDANL